MSWLWPDIHDQRQALRATRPAFWASLLQSIPLVLGSAVDIVQGVAFVAIAIGIRAKRPGAAVAGIACICVYTIPVAFNVFLAPYLLLPLGIVFSIFVLIGALYLRAVRGLLLYHHLQTTPDGESLRVATPWLAIPVAFLMTSPILFSSYVETSGHMENTLLRGDRLVLESISGWLRLRPGRGDLVAFRVPTDVSHLSVGRVIGTPNDRVRMIDKKVWINGQEVSEPYAVHNPDSIDTYRDNLPPPAVPRDPPGDPDGRIDLPENSLGWVISDFGDYVSNGELVVPDGSYFVLGDNRDASWDSRFEGFVAQDQIRGTPLFVYWSREYDEDSAELGPIRWSRIGTRTRDHSLESSN